MEFHEIARIARDWSVLILALPALVLMVVQGVVLWYVTRAMRRFLPQVRPALRRASAAVSRAGEVVEHARRQVETPILSVRAAPARATGFVRALRGRGRGR